MKELLHQSWEGSKTGLDEDVVEDGGHNSIETLGAQSKATECDSRLDDKTSWRVRVKGGRDVKLFHDL